MANRVSSGYEAPRLRIFGDVREITQLVGNKGTLDGGKGATDKTEP